ncbi:hypothetical protein G9A89_013245 [Geosiphon pyriformis]|nr:hypothetical protein G9A89_013245 [Geosiphon pyriformis]
MSTQFLVFMVGSVVEDAFEKNREVYDSVSWHYLRASLWHIKMCERFIEFFGNIYKDRVNRVMTNFGLSDGYRVHDVKRHEQLCRYYIDSKFVVKMGRVKGVGGITCYFAAGTFVDDTIWVENCQVFTQYALKIASEFFKINNISINNDKMVGIFINQSVKVAFLNICGQPISIVKKGKVHHYLGIFLSMERLSKPSIAKAYSDICFFVNVVLRKAITDKHSTGSGQSGGLNILKSDVFFAVKDDLHDVWSDCFKVYTDGSLKGAGSADVICGATAYFLALDLSIGVAVYGLLLSTLAKLQAIALFLKCVPSSWHFGISDNVKADLVAGEAVQSPFTLLVEVCKQFLVAENTAVSGNACYFVRDIFQSISYAYWEAGFEYGVIPNGLVGSVDWISTVKM